MESNFKGTNKVLLEYLPFQRLFFVFVLQHLLKFVAIRGLKI